jgi:hypothetical protein
MNTEFTHKEKKMEIITGEKTGIKVVEYNGVFSTISCRLYQDKLYENWGRLLFGKDKTVSDKSQPFKCVWGDKATAEASLLAALKEVSGKDYVPADIPF